MMAKEVIKVASPAQYIASTGLDNKKKRVAAYARVSTDSEDQIHSFKAQIEDVYKRQALVLASIPPGLGEGGLLGDHVHGGSVIPWVGKKVVAGNFTVKVGRCV